MSPNRSRKKTSQDSEGVMNNDNEGPVEEPVFEVIVLGPNGGPREDRVTGMLVRSTSTDWKPNSLIAVDGGTLLAGIIRLLKKDIAGAKDGVMQSGPFAGLQLPFESAEANGAHVFREIIDAVLITHPHLDHISGLAINTPIVEAGNGPKSVAALPSVIAAIKNHMFNDVIWPNLSDEDGGAGLLTYNRLVEGGNNRFGVGAVRGYVRACTGLTTKCLIVSHGKCKQRYHAETAMHHRINSTVFAPHPSEHFMLPSRAMSMEPTDASFYSPARSPRLSALKEAPMATVESSAFFLRDNLTGKEIIIFGDVEPDSIALEPHNRRIWQTAAPKIASGLLRAIFIECSYNDSVDDAYLYGHLCPRHLIAELKVLAKLVMEARERKTQTDSGESSMATQNSKRKYSSAPNEDPTSISPRSIKRTRSMAGRADLTRSRTFGTPDDPALYEEEEIFDGNDLNSSRWADADPLPLAGLSVYIIHIKETLNDGPPPGYEILNELQEQGDESYLGCQFFLPDTEKGIFIT